MKYELPSTELIVTEENNYLKFGEYLNDMQCDDTTNKLCLDDLEYVKELQQENKQLKAELQLYQGALKRENEAIHRVNDLEEENQELKKQLEENKDKINWYENFEINKTIDKLRIKHNNQQKEFINFLEDNYKETQDIWYIKILQKYKEIIGVK